MKKEMTFEKTYTRYPFAPLVTLGLEIAAWLKRMTKDAGKPAKAKHAGEVTGKVGHAA